MNTVFNIDVYGLRVLTELIKGKYPELSNTEIRRLIEHNAVRIRGEWNGQRADAIINIGDFENSVLLDEIDQVDYDNFKLKLMLPSENKFSFVMIGKRKYIKL